MRTEELKSHLPLKTASMHEECFVVDALAIAKGNNRILIRKEDLTYLFSSIKSHFGIEMEWNNILQ